MHTVERFFVIGRSLLLFTHTCPVTEFAVALHLNTANSCATAFSYGTFGSKSAYTSTATLSFPHLHKNCFFILIP